MWMSPEMIEAGSYDARTDLWSLGITAIELAEMHPPMHDVSPPVRVLFLIPSQSPPQLKQPERWSRSFHEFVASCLTKDPAKRPGASQALALPFAVTAEGSGGGVLTELVRMHQQRGAQHRSTPAASSPGSTLHSTLRQAAQIHPDPCVVCVAVS